jgi:hypothetical protein
VKALAHGDDYVAAGEPESLRWMKTEIEKKFEIKSKLFGPDRAKDEQPEIFILGRILEWHADTVTYEAVPRHAEKIIKDLGLENGKGLRTPGVKPESTNSEGDAEKTGATRTGAEATRYRAIAARLNYLRSTPQKRRAVE